MNTNNNIAEAPQAINLTIVPTMPEKNAIIVSRSGKAVGEKFWFSPLTASELKTKLKAQHPTKTGKQISALVNEALRSEKAQRTVLGLAFVQAMAEKGFVPDEAAVRAKSATLKFVNAEAATVSADVVKAQLAEKDAVNEALMARLAALEAAMTEKGIEIPAPTAAQK